MATGRSRRGSIWIAKGGVMGRQSR